MKRRLHIERILIFYDFPQLFLAKDNLGLDYLCLLTKYDTDGYHYHIVSTSKSILYQFLSGQKDLRDIFTNPEMQEWWVATNTSENEFEVELYSIEELEENYLPDPGFFYVEEKVEDEIVKEAVEHDNVIVHLSLSDENNNQSIRLEDLGYFVNTFQSVVKHTYRKALNDIDSSDKSKYKSFFTPNNYELDAFAASSGSFNLHLVSNSEHNLFGEYLIEKSLQKIDEVITYHESEEEVINSLRQISGHALSNYKKILERIINHNITFKYKWTSPTSMVVHEKELNKEYAIRVSDVLKLKDELVTEKVEFIGFVTQADVKNGSWRIINDEDGKDYKGESSGNLLEGITLETVKYKFICDEVIEAEMVTGAEKTNYILNSIIQVE